MDEVDRILKAWARETPDLDVSPLRVLSRVSRLARYLDFARREAFARHNLDTWEFDVLAALRREGAPYELSPGQLIQQTLSTSGTMTNRIDRLAERGLVERVTTDAEILESTSIPPQTTRAKLRGDFVKAAQSARRDYTVDWVHLKLNDQAQRTVLCKDPFANVDERVERLIEAM